ncbi:unnamed protein product [Brassica rapa subsp. trilocularis]|uniref:(rape) hypothetical protein n=1 Tax=Brassica napus TaxID=3708 RepID=A0A816VZ12_BRANA|nr:unnamed protein product [Brassica napus]
MGAENPRYQNRRATATLTRRAPLQKNSGSTNANQCRRDTDHLLEPRPRIGTDMRRSHHIYDPKATSGELPPQPTSLRPTHSTSGPPYHLHTQQHNTPRGEIEITGATRAVLKPPESQPSLLTPLTPNQSPPPKVDIIQATSKKVITRDEWEKKLNAVKLRKEDMNTLVMNFLVTEGFVEAADKFQRESGTKPEIDLATITDRMAVKKAVQNGNVEDAIEKVNDLNPEILDTNPELFFHLQQQRLIELIRQGKTEEALEFAQEELAPRGEENQAFLQELEKTVALLVFEDASNCPVKDLLDISHRLKTASEVNAAILTSQSHEKDPKLPSLLKMLIWAQNQLDEKAVYPHINDLSTGQLQNPSE